MPDAFARNLIGIQTFLFEKMSSVKWRPFCLGFGVLRILLCNCVEKTTECKLPGLRVHSQIHELQIIPKRHYRLSKKGG